MEKWHIKKDTFAERMNATGNTYANLAVKAKVSPGSIRNALHVGCGLQIIEAIGRSGFDMGDAWRTLLVDKDRRRLEAMAPEGVYPINWEEFANGAEAVGKKLFQELCINTLLTFPGPSLIFTGLIMAKALPRKEIMRVPVYTAIFVDKNASLCDFPQFDAVPMERFTILVPQALVQDYPGREKKIGVVDDAILTGKTMDALRIYFKGLNQKPARVDFACYVCHRSRTFLEETTPIHKFARQEEKFRMPWGNTAFPFEHCFGSEERKRR